MIAEIQQNSNTTYRIYDYGRVGADGKPRQLHVEKAQMVTRLAPPDREAALPVLRASLERMWPLVEPLGVKKPELKARFMTSRWGSCHWTRGIIVLNTALTVVPQELLDYVTLHELVHFLHPNHGAGFYAAMDRLLPEWRVRRSALRSYTLAR